MGLTSFVALPVEAGGAIVREQLERNDDADRTSALMSVAYGLSGKQTLLFGVPYRLSPGGSDQLGDVSALYRHIAMQKDGPGRTTRVALLAGAIVPAGSDRHGAAQAGLVATLYRERYELDFDFLHQPGFASRPDAARYDVSWQYRLTPAEYPEWGLTSEWDVVLELGGRYEQGNETIHQATAGLQWIHRKWVLEGGVIRKLNGPRDTLGLLSLRWHVAPNRKR